MRRMFEDLYSQLDSVGRQTVTRLAEIEKEDADICASCGGEDCICCEIYHDRKKWASPQEFFSDYSAW